MLMSLTNSVVHTIRETTRAQFLIAAAINGLHTPSSGKEIHKLTQIHEIDVASTIAPHKGREIPYKPQIMANEIAERPASLAQ